MEDIRKLRQNALEKYFSHLNPEQRQAVFTVKGPVLILAGAGSGKTTVLVNRIANMIMFGNAYFSDKEDELSDEDMAFIRDFDSAGDEEDVRRLSSLIGVDTVQPWSILAITFTNKAADELKSRLALMLGDETGSEVRASTFHSACVRILRREIDALGYGKGFTIYDADDSKRLIKACMDDCGADTRKFSLNAVASAISRAKDTLQDENDLEADANGDYRNETIAEIYREYQKRLKAANALDFDDIIMKTVQLFEEHPDVLDHYCNLYRYILVDEYQDTNHAQYRLVSLLAHKYGNLCVVGDDDQSIYRFRGATVENILSFEDEFKDCTTIKLEQNYRSTQNILDGANSVIAKNHERKSKTLWSDRGEGEKIQLCEVEDEREEAKLIIREIEKLRKKEELDYSDFTVLYRMNAQSNSLERQFSLKNIPYRVIGGLRFYDRKEVKDILAYLTMTINEYDTVRFSRIINEPKRNIGEATVSSILEIALDLNMSPIEVMRNADNYTKLVRKAAQLRNTAAMFDSIKAYSEEHTPVELVDQIMQITGYKAMLDADGETGTARLQNIEELKSSIAQYINDTIDSEENEPTLEGFLENIALYAEKDNGGEADAVNMMTIHTAKGLEFPVIFIAGMENGIFPSDRVFTSSTELEEERRLAYVAMTRAKQRLYIIYADERMLFGRTQYNDKSMFVGEIDKNCTEKYAPFRDEVEAMPKAMPRPVVKNIRKNAVRASSSGEMMSFSVGERVAHPKFGEGFVINAQSMGNDWMLEVAFDSVGTKKIMAKFAKMKKI